jgi:hypothetical protein
VLLGAENILRNIERQLRGCPEVHFPTAADNFPDAAGAFLMPAIYFPATANAFPSTVNYFPPPADNFPSPEGAFPPPVDAFPLVDVGFGVCVVNWSFWKLEGCL